MKTIYTIGHSNKKIEEFINKLKEFQIEVLVDARSIPYSKWNAQFNREAMRKDLEDAGIVYAYRGKNLGGLQNNTGWNEAIEELATKCESKRICICCSEADPNNCHRQSKIQPELEKQGVKVIHILWKELEKKKEIIKPLTLF